MWGYGEGETYFPGVARPRRRGHVRRGRRAGDAGAVDPQPRQRGRRRGEPDDDGGRRPPLPRDGHPAHPRGGGGRGRPGGVRRRLRGPPATSPPAPATASRRSAPRPTPSPSSTTTSAPRSPPRSRRSGPGRRCSSTPTTSPRASAPPSTVAGTGLGAVRLDSGDLLEQAHAVRAQLDELGATDTRIVVTSDLDEYAIAALAAAPVDSYGVGTSLVTGSGAPTAGHGLQARRARGRGREPGRRRQAQRRQAQRRRPQAAAAPPGRRRDRGRGGHRHRPPAGSATATTGRCCGSSSPAARRSARSPWTRRGRGT